MFAPYNANGKTVAEFNADVDRWWASKPKRGGQPILKPEQEAALVAWSKQWIGSDIPGMGDGLSVGKLKGLIDELRQDGRKTDRHVVARLQKKHKKILNPTKGRAISSPRALAGSRVVFQEYFDLLQKTLFDEQKNPRGYKYVLSLDETMISGSGIVTKQKRKEFFTLPGLISSVNTPALTNHITLLGIANATGDGIIPFYLPPVLIYERKSKGEIVQVPVTAFEDAHLPKHTQVSFNETGFMNKDLFFKILKEHIPKCTNLEKEKLHQVLILCDDPSQHTLSPEQEHELREMGIDLIPLPHNTSQWLQACDQLIFASLKNSWNEILQDYSRTHLGKAPTIWEVAGMMQSSFERSMSRRTVSAVKPVIRAISLPNLLVRTTIL